jgi:hypothetical protein
MQYQGSKQVPIDVATDVVEKAFAVWQEATCADGMRPALSVDHRFGQAACDLHEYNQTDANANIIMFRDGVWPYESAQNVLALTTVTYSRRTGAIFDVDMEVNSTHQISVGDPVPATSYDLQSIMAHEAGHFLGLAHSSDPMSTMVAKYTSGMQSFRNLGLDDQEAICTVYPPSNPLVCDYNPRQGFSPECGIFPSGDGGKCAVAPLGPGGRDSERARFGGAAAACALLVLMIGRRRRVYDGER